MRRLGIFFALEHELLVWLFFSRHSIDRDFAFQARAFALKKSDIDLLISIRVKNIILLTRTLPVLVYYVRLKLHWFFLGR
jgi:hypothetical protein